MFIYKVIFRG